MADFLINFKNRTLTPLGQLSYAQRITMGLVILLTIIGTGVLLKWATQPDYAVLTSEIDPADAQAIVEELQSNNVPYKLTQSGRGIMVPRKEVYEWRMKLAAQNLPASSNLGYELFDRKEIGVSDFVQKLNFRRALEGELSRTIQSMPEVNKARVHLVFPEDRLFKEDQQQATASIFLSLRGRRGLNESQVLGISRMVAGSAEGLRPENVTIVDEHGNILSKNDSIDSVSGLTDSQLQIRRRVESYLEHKAQSMLDRVLGPGNTIIRVTADLDFRRVEKTNEIYNPDNAVVLSEEIENQTVTDSASGGENAVEHTITNYQLAKTIEHIVDGIGNIEKLSIAVLVNGRNVERENDAGELVNEYIPRTNDELTRLSTLVRNAVGFNMDRGDQLDIQNLPFEVPQWDQENKVLEQLDVLTPFMPIIQKILAGLAIIIGILFVRSKIKKAKKALAEMAKKAEEKRALTEPAGRGQGFGGGSKFTSDKAAEEYLDFANEFEEMSKQGARQKEVLSEFVVNNPSTVAQLIRSWMMEG